MSRAQRKRYSAEFKAKVALEPIKAEQALRALGNHYGLNSNMITCWQRHVIARLSEHRGQSL